MAMPQLTGAQKGAIVLLALERDQAARILRQLPQSTLERILPHMAKPIPLGPDAHEQVLRQTAQAVAAIGSLGEGGLEYTERLLTEALGTNRAALLMRQLTAGTTEQPFSILLRADPDQAAAVLAKEHPQLIALMLAYIPAPVASGLLAKLPDTVAAETTRRLAHLRYVNPSVIKHLEAVLEKNLSATQTVEIADGVERIIPILNASDPSKEQAILDRLSTIDPELASQVRDQLFTFEDVRKLDDALLQTILRRIDLPVLAMALRKATHELQDRIYANMTEEQGALLHEEIETLGAQSVRNVENAQHQITTLIHEMEDAGEIELPHGDQEAMV
jgi:flagellar motor switch protein FliG